MSYLLTATLFAGVILLMFVVASAISGPLMRMRAPQTPARVAGFIMSALLVYALSGWFDVNPTTTHEKIAKWWDAPPNTAQGNVAPPAEPAKPASITCETKLKRIQLPWGSRITYHLETQEEDCKSPWFIRPLNPATNLRSARFSWSADVDVCVEHAYADKAPDEKCTVISPFRDGIIPNTVTAVRFSGVREDATIHFVFVW